MCSHYAFRQLSPRRKVALTVAVGWFVLFAAWVLPQALRSPPQSWPIILVLLCVTFSAFSSAVASIELVRAGVPSTASWSDETHFRATGITFLLLLVVQFTGALMALSSHGQSAF
jgi:hypothetical protein